MDGGTAMALQHAATSAPEAEVPEWAQRAAELLGRPGWTAAEIASFAVPGLPTTKRGVRDLMQAERVIFEVQDGPGGEVHVFNKYSMRSAIRTAIARRLASFLRHCLPAAPAGAGLPELATVTRSQQALLSLPPKLALRADARAAVLAAFETWSGGAGKVGARGADLFCQAYSAGAVSVPDWVRTIVPSCCGKSLLSWRKIRAERGVAGLAGDYKPRQATLDVSDALAGTAEGFLLEHPSANATQLLQTLEAEHPGVVLPTVRSIQRWLDAWRKENRQLHANLVSPDAHRSRFRPAFGNASAGIVRVNQLWEMDSTPGDVMLLDGRHTVVGVVDVFSRRKRLLVWPTSSSEGIALLIRRALLEWGVPEVLRTDNGADYTSAHIVRLCADLGIERDVTNPFSPEEKPHIERALGVFSHGLVELLPGYTGHNVAEAQAIRSRRSFAQQLMKQGGAAQVKLTAAEFQDFCDRWCRDLYENRRHGGIGTTPRLRAAACQAPQRRIEDERALDVLLAPLAGGNGQRVVGKKGIRVDGGHFIAPELGLRVGEAVQCRADPADLGRIYVFDEDGAFICVAEDPDRTGIDREAVAQAAKAIAKRGISEGRAKMREAARGKLKGKALTDAILATAAMKAEAATVVAFPRPVTPHSTPAIEQHGRAARADEAPRAPERTAADALRADWLAQKAARAAEAAAATSADAQKAARLARARAIRAAAAEGTPISDEDRRWFDAYRTGAEWRWACTVEGTDPAAVRFNQA
ncbi:Mu transposase C-terminal domain-containing protein [Falsiroseomonas sp.]|uniref:Mu transposase C-terminal domain-containing protein n=1 Tax=Falsiroseomonas sp. TaxID=2870721 RepID=UPI003F72B1A9